MASSRAESRTGGQLPGGWMPFGAVLGMFLMLALSPGARADGARPPNGDGELRGWLENMVGHHGFSVGEVQAATGLTEEAIRAGLARWRIEPFGAGVGTEAARTATRVLPYPGGRHPRLGFFDGAVDPQRETKLSVFTPWDPRSYVVVDVPEAIFTQAGLVYLAHTHFPTVWEQQGVRLPALEWRRRADGVLEMERTLPDGLAFGVMARPGSNGVSMRWWMRNGSTNTIRRIRSQVCVMLGRAAGFEGQTATNKLLDGPFAACGDGSGKRWVITAWNGLDRVWQNPPVPCIHADPRMDDLAPGETGVARGWLWFFEGEDVRGEIARLRKGEVGKPDTGPLVERRALREPVPDKLVVLTFDDSVASQYHVVRPLLKKAGFGATFFITEGFSFVSNKVEYLTWQQIAELHRDGFEIGNHTQSHMGASAGTLGRLRQEVQYIANRCVENGIPRPVSFGYPGNAIHPGALPILKRLGIRFARRGAQPEFAYETGRGVAFEPGRDDALLVPTTGDARPTWTLDDLKRAVSAAKEGRVAVLQFHGVPDREHPWVNTPAERFTEYVEWLKANGYRCIALRDLERYVDPEVAMADPWAVMDWRRTRGGGR